MYYICKFDRDFGDTQVDGAFSNKDKAKEECKYLNMCVCSTMYRVSDN